MFSMGEFRAVEGIAIRDNLLDYGEWSLYVNRVWTEQEKPSWFYNGDMRKTEYIKYVRTTLEARIQNSAQETQDG